MDISFFLSMLVFATLIISLCINNRTKSLIIQMISCIFEAIYCLVINAFTSAFLNLINGIRTLIFINSNKFGKTLYIIILVLFEGIIIFNCIYTWSGVISLLPTIGSFFRTYCLWQMNQRLVRISGITTGITYGLYYTYYHGWIMVIGDILLIIAGIYAIYKYDIKCKVQKIN